MIKKKIQEGLVRKFILGSLIILFFSCATKKPIPGIEELNQPIIKNYAEQALVFNGKIQVIAYNIERGEFWEDVVKYLKEQKSEVPATIILLSEADRMHSRSGDVFTAEQMAKALKMNLVFVPEFIEYNDKTKDSPADHGNAILSPFPINDISVIRHTDVYSWSRWGWLWAQPRKGERVSIGATLILPNGTELRVYTVHFESHALSQQRIIQMKEVLEEASKYEIPVVIGGDFNEFRSGKIFKLIPKYGFENSFQNNSQPTGNCRIIDEQIKCKGKIDWIVHKGLTLMESAVDYPINSQGRVISDHAPVRAIYQTK